MRIGATSEAMKPRSAKAKGSRLEKWTRDFLRQQGLHADKQPGSGIYQGYEHDVMAKLPDGSRFLVECKARAEGHKTLDRWIGKADILIIKRDRESPMWYVSTEFIERLLGLANGRPG